MQTAEIVAFVPVLNAGVEKLSDFEFCSGVKLTGSDIPTPLRAAQDSLWQSDYVSRTECRMLEGARGALWISSQHVQPEPRLVIAEVTRLSLALQNVLWCIYCHPYGENEYWRYGNLVAECGAYVMTPLGSLFSAPRRFPFLYGIAGEQGSLRGWSDKVLVSADSLLRGMASCPERIPRVYLAGHHQRIMASTDIMLYATVRLQLCITALETFYVGSTDGRKYIWTDDIAQRVRKICDSNMDIPGAFFGDLRELRNDMVHRGGLSVEGHVDPRFAKVLIRSERILRETIKWALLNLPKVRDAFAKDEWPE